MLVGELQLATGKGEKDGTTRVEERLTPWNFEAVRSVLTFADLKPFSMGSLRRCRSVAMVSGGYPMRLGTRIMDGRREFQLGSSEQT